MKRSLLALTFISMFLLMGGAGCISFSKKQSITSGPAGVFVSLNKSESWQQVNALPKADGVKSVAGVSVYRLVDDPQDASAMYLASRGDGLFFTYDDGKTWQQPENTLNTGFIYSVAVHPKNKCVIYATNGQQVFRSDDCNRSWKEVYRESRSDVLLISLAFNNFSPYQIYLATSNGDLLQSFDSGTSWQVIKRFKTKLYHVVPSHLQENLIYLVTKQSGLYRTEDGGENWESVYSGLKEFSGSLEYRRHLLHPTKPDSLFWISTYGILRSDDRGNTWKALDLITPPGSVNVYSFALNPQNENEMYYTATVSGKSTFYKSVDGGKNWVTKKLPTDQLPVVLRVHPKSGDTVYLGFTIPPAPKK